MSSNLKVLPRTIGQLVAAGAFSATFAASALAQQQPSAPQSDGSPANGVQRVEITGSYIRRADAETPSPVQVINAKDLKNSGYTSVGEVLQNITANGAGTLSQNFSRAALPPAAAASRCAA